MLILSESQVRRCLSLDKCIASNIKALGSLRSSKGDGDNQQHPAPLPSPAVVPARTALPRCLNQPPRPSSSIAVPNDTTLFKPAAYYGSEKDETLMGVKVISVRAKNSSIGKPTAPSTITMLDAESGEVTAVIAGTYLTATRTAAGSAIATKICLEQKQLNDTHDKHLVVFGAGIQSEMHIRMLNCILPNQIRKVTIFNRTRKRAEKLRDELMNDPETSNLECSIVTLDEERRIKEIVGKADIIVTATNTAFPLFDWSWVNNDCHINGVGSYLPSTEEVDSVFVRDHCITVADTIEALDVGDLKELDGRSDNFVGLLGDLLSGKVTLGHRAGSNKRTFFKSVGTSVQDIFTADQVIKTAISLGIGTEVEM
jgi:ornithine cyclodeaminase